MSIDWESYSLIHFRALSSLLPFYTFSIYLLLTIGLLLHTHTQVIHFVSFRFFYHHRHHRCHHSLPSSLSPPCTVYSNEIECTVNGAVHSPPPLSPSLLCVVPGEHSKSTALAESISLCLSTFTHSYTHRHTHKSSKLSIYCLRTSEMCVCEKEWIM